MSTRRQRGHYCDECKETFASRTAAVKHSDQKEHKIRWAWAWTCARCGLFFQLRVDAKEHEEKCRGFVYIPRDV